MTDNPYALTQLKAHGATYCGENHTASVNNTNTPPECLMVEVLHMFGRKFPIAGLVDNVLAWEVDVGLTAEVRRW